MRFLACLIALTLALLAAPISAAACDLAAAAIAVDGGTKLQAKHDAAGALQLYNRAFDSAADCQSQKSNLITAQATMGALETDKTPSLRSPRINLVRKTIELYGNGALRANDRAALNSVQRRLTAFTGTSPDIRGDPSINVDGWEVGWLVKDISSGDVEMIERPNGERWIIQAMGYCVWCFLYEGKKVLIQFNLATTKMMPGDGSHSSLMFFTKSEVR
jgi:hypothetical protein